MEKEDIHLKFAIIITPSFILDYQKKILRLEYQKIDKLYYQNNTTIWKIELTIIR